MSKRKNSVIQLIITFTLLIGILYWKTPSSLAEISNARSQNQLYITEVEGLSHAFTATLYKVVNNGVLQVRVEKIDVSNQIPPIYSTNRNVGTNFSSAQVAINTVRNNVYNLLQIREMMGNVYGFAVKNGVESVHVSLLYRCYIGGKQKDVLLYYNYKVHNNPNVWNTTIPRTSGYLIVNPNPVWIRITYISRVLDPSLKRLATYSKIQSVMYTTGDGLHGLGGG